MVNWQERFTKRERNEDRQIYLPTTTTWHQWQSHAHILCVGKNTLVGYYCPSIANLKRHWENEPGMIFITVKQYFRPIFVNISSHQAKWKYASQAFWTVAARADVLNKRGELPNCYQFISPRNPKPALWGHLSTLMDPKSALLGPKFILSGLKSALSGPK